MNSCSTLQPQTAQMDIVHQYPFFMSLLQAYMPAGKTLRCAAQIPFQGGAWCPAVGSGQQASLMYQLEGLPVLG